jgi:hypothetical protein
MTQTNRLLFVTVLALLAGVLYETRLLTVQHRDRRHVADQLAVTQKQIEAWRRERGIADTARAALEKEIHDAEATTEVKGAAANDAGLTAWLQRVDHLKDWLRQNSARQIPEMRYLNSNDWLSATFDNPLATDAQMRYALKKLRDLAKAKPEIGNNINRAIQAYAQEHGGTPVPAADQLSAYLNPPLGNDILARYVSVPEIPGENDRNGVARGHNFFGGSGRAVLEEQPLADDDYDERLLFMEQGYGWFGVSQISDAVSQATTAFNKANPGVKLSQPEQLLPYLNPPVKEQALREYWEIKDWK